MERISVKLFLIKQDLIIKCSFWLAVLIEHRILDRSFVLNLLVVFLFLLPFFTLFALVVNICDDWLVSEFFQILVFICDYVGSFLGSSCSSRWIFKINNWGILNRVRISLRLSV